MKRFHCLIVGLAVGFVALSLLHPGAALADFPSSADSFLKGNVAKDWFKTLKSMAGHLYLGLFTLELVVVGVQGVLYKDNIAEFLQTVVFKVVMASAMIALIANANLIFPVVVSLFKQTATQTISSACQSNPSSTCQTVDDSNPLELEGHFIEWAMFYFTAADISRAADSAASSAAGIMVFGTGLPGLSTAFLLGHANFEIFCIALGMICITAAGAVLLTYLLLTFETQIIMMIGVFFLAFQGSRFTAQFAQGYMSYCVNIGVKFFVYFFIVAILKTVTTDPSLEGLLGSLAAGAAIPFGAGSIAVVAATSSIPVICVVSGILVAAIPNFASSLLSGSSALSAGAAMGQLSGALASAGKMNDAAGQQQAAMHQKNDAAHAKHELGDRTQTHEKPHTQGGAHHRPETPQAIPAVNIGPPPQAPHATSGDATNAPSTGTARTPEPTWNAGGNAYGTTGPNGSSAANASNAPLAEREPEDIRRMKPAELHEAAMRSDWGELNDAQKSAIEADPKLRAAAERAYDKKGKSASKALNSSQSAIFLTSLGGAAPPPEAPPSAVQVRVSNPDKL